MMTGTMPACRVVHPTGGHEETLLYLDRHGDQLFVAQHHAQGRRRGAVLLCGSIGVERERAYRTLVDLARGLAAAGFEVLRFDYRGIGESTGHFARLCLSDWRDDVQACVAHLRSTVPGSPLGLWGVRAGALLASGLFLEGLGEGAMFCAPADGRRLLQDMLRRSLVADMVARPGAARRSREEIIAALADGSTVAIDGYPWGGRLWEDAAAHRFAHPPAGEVRPWCILGQDGSARGPGSSRLAKDFSRQGLEPFWLGSPTLVPGTTGLLTRTLAWLHQLSAARRPA